LAKGFFGKVLSIIGLESEEDALPEEEMAMEEDAEEEVAATAEGSRRRGSIVAIAQPKAMRMVVVEPAAFDEVQAIALNLRNRRPVIVNLERTDREVARRIVDFLSGATYALGGAMQRVGGAIFLFAPQNVDVAAQSREFGGEDISGSVWPPK
jgi:cell division inhibitor SepF